MLILLQSAELSAGLAGIWDNITTIFLIGSIISLFISLFVLPISFWCLERYNPQARLLAWRNDRLVKSLVVTLIFGSAAAFTVIGIVQELSPGQFGSSRLVAAYFALWAYWLLTIRAAAVDKLDEDPEMNVPSPPWPRWCRAGLILAGLPLLIIGHDSAKRQAEGLPSALDSIDAKAFGGILAAMILSPVVLGVAGFCLQRYHSQARLWALRNNCLLRSFGTIFILGSAAAYVIGGINEAYAPDLPVCEPAWLTYSALWLSWLLAMRAAVVDQLKPDPI